MCGIAGVYGRTNRTVLDGMLDCLSHRGPDDQGTFFRPESSLMMGARRLAIVDLEGGDQPISNEDGTVSVVFNGEIYNYPRLRRELEEQGHQFETNCDTEVLVHLWEEEGPDMPARLNGMFAFSLWDETSEQLFLARDRVGINPLYYATTDFGFVWGSEPAAVLRAGVDRELDERAVYNYFSLRYTPVPQTLFENVRKVPPGTAILVENGDVSRRTYWNLPRREVTASPERIATRVRTLLEQSVERRLMADVPVGAFLSGGIDSSAVVGILSEKCSEPPQTYSIGFRGEAIDESSEAAFVADHFGTDHTEITVDLSSMDVFGEIVEQFGDPLSDPAALPTALLAQRASTDLKVVMTGEGADELFAGYWYNRRFPKHRTIAKKVPQRLFRTIERIDDVIPVADEHFEYLSSLGSDGEIGLYLARRFGIPPDSYLTTELTPETSGLRDMIHASYSQGGDDLLDKISTFDIEYWLPDDLLYKVDQTTMMTSLEARVPFLDHELIEFAYNIPSQHKLSSAEKKPVLRRAVADVLPERTLNRSKHGFIVPIDDWFRNDHEAITGWLTEERLRSTPYLDPERIFSMWTEHKRENATYGSTLWKVLNYVAWYDIFGESTE